MTHEHGHDEHGHDDHGHDDPHPPDHHGHPHGHRHDHGPADAAHPDLDLSVPDSELPPHALGRRNFLRAAGVLGAGVAAASLVDSTGAPSAAAQESDEMQRRRGGDRGTQWLAGDHHIHTQFSPDGMYRVVDHVKHASAYGLDWMVITDHGSAQHAKIGVEKVNPLIKAARATYPNMLVFQGLEWNIPAAEHGTVFVHPGGNEVAVLREFENAYDGVVKKATDSNPDNEKLAVAGIQFLASAVGNRRVQDALMFANHPARKGIDSPHEIRAWRDAATGIAMGMEGAPGHQAAGLAAPLGPGSGRGYYDNSRSKDSFAAYPDESYRTYGGFDWMTSTVGGLWDSLLAEGKAWWITANSDSHSIYLDTAVRGGPDSDFAAQGFYADPVNGPAPVTKNGDYWPGCYSRTHVGVGRATYAAVMDGLRAGRIWVDHGGLLDVCDVKVSGGGSGAGLGGTVIVRPGTKASVSITITPAAQPNWACFVPRLARVDAIVGPVTGPAADRDVFVAKETKVVQSWDVTSHGPGESFTLTLRLPEVAERGCYVRFRGSDGKRLAPGLMGAAVDPAGPAVDVMGSANPWDDLWFYTNPVWVLRGGSR